jgi:hypothetical protein
MGLWTGISVMLNSGDYCSVSGERIASRTAILLVNVGVPPSDGMPCPQVGGLIVAGSLGLGLLVLLYVAWRVGAIEIALKRLNTTTSQDLSQSSPPS